MSIVVFSPAQGHGRCQFNFIYDVSPALRSIAYVVVWVVF